MVFSWTTLPLDLPLVRYYSATKQVVTRPVKVHHFRRAGQTQHPKEMTDLHTQVALSAEGKENNFKKSEKSTQRAIADKMQKANEAV